MYCFTHDTIHNTQELVACLLEVLKEADNDH